MTRTIFKCKTNDAYKFKILAELLSNNIKTGSFEITDKGISLCMFDRPRKIMIDLKLDMDNFSHFKLAVPVLHVGVNLKHLYKILKSTKKKDSLQLFIDRDRPTELNIRSYPKENTRITTSTLKILNLQHIQCEAPTNYNFPVNINATDFQKMCKELISIGSSTIDVESRNGLIYFSSDADGIISRKVRLGEPNEGGESESDSDESTCETYSASFATDLVQRFQKLANLGDTVQVYTNKELPLLIKTNVGILGKIAVYVKSIDLINEDNDAIDS